MISQLKQIQEIDKKEPLRIAKKKKISKII